MKNLFLISSLLLLSFSAIAQEAFSSLEEQMTGKEFTASGLGKLSDAELAALNDWLRAHSVATLDTAREPTSDGRGFEDQAIAGMDDSTIVSRIAGPFNGWDGDTVFTLENGMVWKQSESHRFYISEIQNPVVTIDKGLFGSWRLKVEGYNKEIQVKRIQ